MSTSGYYRTDCHRMAPFYDHLVALALLPAGGEMKLRRAVLAAASVEPGQRVLDLCCGTGTLAGLLVEEVGAAGEVVGVDFSEAMLAAARRKVRSANATFLRANAEDLPFPSHRFHRVTITLALHELTARGRRNVLVEAYRVLQPGGRLIVADLHYPPGWVKRALFRLYMLLETENAWEMVREDLPAVLKGLGFDSVQQDIGFGGFLQILTATKPSLAAHPAPPEQE